MQPSSWEQDSWKEVSRSPTLTPGIDGSGAQTMLSEISFSLFLGPALSLLILVSDKLCPPGGVTAGVVTQKFLDSFQCRKGIFLCPRNPNKSFPSPSWLCWGIVSIPDTVMDLGKWLARPDSWALECGEDGALGNHRDGDLGFRVRWAPKQKSTVTTGKNLLDY